LDLSIHVLVEVVVLAQTQLMSRPLCNGNAYVCVSYKPAEGQKYTSRCGGGASQRFTTTPPKVPPVYVDKICRYSNPEINEFLEAIARCTCE